MSSLVWSPVYRAIESRIRSGDRLIFIISPFIKLEALRRLRSTQDATFAPKVVARWRPSDLLSGASDLDIFPYLNSLGSPLFINNSIHLKLYVFESNTAFSSSGNLTSKGLGYSDAPNVEVGSMTDLSPADWAKIYDVVRSSQVVDNESYIRFGKYLSQLPQAPTVPSELPAPSARKTYTISSLPATEDPSFLAAFYSAPDRSTFTPEQVRCAMHDLSEFGIKDHLSPAEFIALLGTAFLKTPFVTEFLTHLKHRQHLRFGEVNDWIHQKCEDVPLPYRWELKTNTNFFYNWLRYFVPSVSWDRPNYSQIIYWNKK